MATRDQMVLFRALILWDYNVDSGKKFDAVYGASGGPGDPYWEEKIEIISGSSLAAWCGELDFAHQCKVVGAAMAKYGDEAGQWVNVHLSFGT